MSVREASHRNAEASSKGRPSQAGGVNDQVYKEEEGGGSRADSYLGWHADRTN